MPLKHATETFLVFLLGVLIALTGLLVATLPPFPLGTLPGLVLLAVTLLYPLSLLSLLRRNRADYTFRWLHWVPAGMVLLWFALQGLVVLIPSLVVLLSMYTWGWTLPLVALGFLALAVFCLRVIRRRGLRVCLLAVAFIPFVAGAVMSEQKFHWDREVAALLWGQEWWLRVQHGITGSGAMQVAMEEGMASSDKNLEESADPDEEAWRERLRAFERRRERIAARLLHQGDDEEEMEEENVTSESSSDEAVLEPAYTGTGRELREVATLPDALPSAGAGVGAMGLTLFLSYCGLLHQRAKKRV